MNNSQNLLPLAESELAEHTIAPHKYPKVIVLATTSLILILVYAYTLIPNYVKSARKVSAAQYAYDQGDYYEAVINYRDALRLEPNSKIAKIELARVLFKSDEIDLQLMGLDCLDGLSLNAEDMRKLRQTMPKKFEKYFESIK